jgi:hypothetical protein
MRVISMFFLLGLAAAVPAQAARQTPSDALKETASLPGYQPKGGLVPDAKTAITIAVAVWEPVYGKANIASEAPYEVVLQNGRWTVTGTLRKGGVGGVATAVIDKTNGRIVKIYHTK